MTGLHRALALCLALVASLLAAAGALAQAPADSTAARAPEPAVVRAERLLEENHPKEAVEAGKEAVRDLPDEPNGWFVLARAYHAIGDLDDAIETGHHAVEFATVRASAFYNLACAYALKGDADDAFRALLGAKRAGFADRDQMAHDPDLASLRDDPRFVLPQEPNYFTLHLADTTEVPFSVVLPINYEPARAYPVLVAPGNGKKVKGSWGGLFWGEDTAQRGWITVETPAFVVKDPVTAVSRLLDEIGRRYKVEGGKVHLIGYGPVAGAVFGVAMAVPDRIKSISAVPGFPGTVDDAELSKLKGVKVSFIVGAEDPLFRNECEAAHHHLQQLGVETYIEVVPGGGPLLTQMFGGEFAERLDLLR